MAECHPVGFRWVMEAKRARRHDHPRRSALHAHERGRRPPRADPRRAATSPSWAGSSATSSKTSATSASTSSTTPTPPAIITEEFRDTEDLDGLFSGWDAENGQYDVEPGCTRASSPAPRRATARRHRRAALRAAASPMPAEHTDPTLQHPRCVFQILKRHFARYTPEMVEETCGIPQDLFLKVARRRCAQLGARAHVGLLLRGRLDAALRRRAVHPRPPRSSRLLLGQHGTARRRHHGAARATPRSRAPPTSRRCTTCCRAICRCPRRSTTGTSQTYIEQQHVAVGLVERVSEVRRLAAEGLVRRARDQRRTTGASTTCRSSPATTPT